MNDDHTGVQLEDIQDQLTRFSEAMADVPQTIRELKSDVGQLKEDFKVIKAALPDLSSQVTDHEHRLTKLEVAG